MDTGYVKRKLAREIAENAAIREALRPLRRRLAAILLSDKVAEEFAAHTGMKVDKARDLAIAVLNAPHSAVWRKPGRPWLPKDQREPGIKGRPKVAPSDPSAST